MIGDAKVRRLAEKIAEKRSKDIYESKMREMSDYTGRKYFEKRPGQSSPWFKEGVHGFSYIDADTGKTHYVSSRKMPYRKVGKRMKPDRAAVRSEVSKAMRMMASVEVRPIRDGYEVVLPFERIPQEFGKDQTVDVSSSTVIGKSNAADREILTAIAEWAMENGYAKPGTISIKSEAKKV